MALPPYNPYAYQTSLPPAQNDPYALDDDAALWLAETEAHTAVQEEEAAPPAPPAPLGAMDALKDIWGSPSQLVPFVGGAIEAKETYDLYAASKRAQAAIEAGGTPDPADMARVQEFQAEQQRRAGGTTLGHKFVSILGQLPGFAGEFAATGGLYAAGRKAAMKVATKGVRKLAAGTAARTIGRVAQKTMATAVGAAAQLPAMPHRVATSVLQRATPEIGYSQDEMGEIEAIVADPGDAPLRAWLAGLGDTYIELFSERTGAALGAKPIRDAAAKFKASPAGQRIAATKAAIAKNWLKRNPNAKAGDFLKKIRSATGWHGVVGEVFEERVGEVMRGVTGIDDYEIPSIDQIGAEILAFSVPGAIGAGVRYGLGDKIKPPVVDEEVAATDIPPIAPASPTLDPNLPAIQGQRVYTDRYGTANVGYSDMLGAERAYEEGLQEGAESIGPRVMADARARSGRLLPAPPEGRPSALRLPPPPLMLPPPPSRLYAGTQPGIVGPNIDEIGVAEEWDRAQQAEENARLEAEAEARRQAAPLPILPPRPVQYVSPEGVGVPPGVLSIDRPSVAPGVVGEAVPIFQTPSPVKPLRPEEIRHDPQYAGRIRPVVQEEDESGGAQAPRGAVQDAGRGGEARGTGEVLPDAQPGEAEPAEAGIAPGAEGVPEEVAPGAAKQPTAGIISFKKGMDIRNLDQLPRGIGARYLEVIRGENDSFVAKQWRRKPIKKGILLDFRPETAEVQPDKFVAKKTKPPKTKRPKTIGLEQKESLLKQIEEAKRNIPAQTEESIRSYKALQAAEDALDKAKEARFLAPGEQWADRSPEKEAAIEKQIKQAEESVEAAEESLVEFPPDILFTLPGGDSFRVRHSKEGLANLEKRAKKISTAQPKGPSKRGKSHPTALKTKERPSSIAALRKNVSSMAAGKSNPREHLRQEYYVPETGEIVATTGKIMAVALTEKGADSPNTAEQGFSHSRVIPHYQEGALPDTTKFERVVPLNIGEVARSLAQVAPVAAAAPKEGAFLLRLGPKGQIAYVGLSHERGVAVIGSAPKTGTTEIALSVPLMKKAIVFLAKAGNSTIKLGYAGEGRPVALIGENDYAIIMPLEIAEVKLKGVKFQSMDKIGGRRVVRLDQSDLLEEKGEAGVTKKEKSVISVSSKPREPTAKEKKTIKAKLLAMKAQKIIFRGNGVSFNFADGPRIRLEAVDALYKEDFGPEAKPQARGPQARGVTVRGHNLRLAGGRTIKGDTIIAIAEASDKTTLGHELFHAVRPLLSASQNATLDKAFANEEAMAEAFGKRDAHPILQRLLDVVQSLYDSFFKSQAGEARRVMRDIGRGELGGVGATAAASEASFQTAQRATPKEIAANVRRSIRDAGSPTRKAASLKSTDWIFPNGLPVAHEGDHGAWAMGLTNASDGIEGINTLAEMGAIRRSTQTGGRGGVSYQFGARPNAMQRGILKRDIAGGDYGMVYVEARAPGADRSFFKEYDVRGGDTARMWRDINDHFNFEESQRAEKVEAVDLPHVYDDATPGVQFQSIPEKNDPTLHPNQPMNVPESAKGTVKESLETLYGQLRTALIDRFDPINRAFKKAIVASGRKIAEIPGMSHVTKLIARVMGHETALAEILTYGMVAPATNDKGEVVMRLYSETKGGYSAITEKPLDDAKITDPDARGRLMEQANARGLSERTKAESAKIRKREEAALKKRNAAYRKKQDREVRRGWRTRKEADALIARVESRRRNILENDLALRDYRLTGIGEGEALDAARATEAKKFREENPGAHSSALGAHMRRFERGLFAKYKSDVGAADAQLAALREDSQAWKITGEMLKRYRGWSNAILRYAYDKGLITKDTYDRVKASGEDNYLSLRRFMSEDAEEDFNAVFTSAGALGVQKKILHAYKGSRRKVKPPQLSLMEMLDEVVGAASKNDVWLAMKDALVGADANRPDFLAAQGIRRLSKPPRERNRAITLYNKGEKEYWQFPKDIMTAANSLHDRENVLSVPLLELPARILRWSVTHSIPFMVRNPSRDLAHRWLLSKVGSSPIDLAKGVSGLWDNADADKRDWEAMYNLGGGGQFGHVNLGQKHFQREQRRAQHKHRADKTTIFAMATKAVDAWDKVAGWTESVNRVAEFKKSLVLHEKKIGQTVGGRKYTAADAWTDAMYDARDLMDFSRAGHLIRFINRYVPFTNAAIQGMSRSIRGIQEDPKTVGARWAMYVAAPTIAVWAYNVANGDEEEYLQQPAYLRDFFWNIKVGEGIWLRIPKPFEMGVLGSGVERAINQARGKKNAFEGYPTSLMTGALPFDEAAMAGPFRTIIEPIANYDFFRGRHITSTFEEGVALPLRKGTERASRIGKLLQKALGVDARTADHILRSQFGTLGSQALQLSDLGREDRAPDIVTLMKQIGLFVESPAYVAADVQAAMALAKKLKLQNSKGSRTLSAYVQRYWKARTQEDRNSAAKRLRRYATRYRDYLEKRAPRILGHAKRRAAARKNNR